MTPISAGNAIELQAKIAASDLTSFFNLGQAPRSFNTISAQKNASFFINDKRPATDPDDQ